MGHLLTIYFNKAAISATKWWIAYSEFVSVRIKFISSKIVCKLHVKLPMSYSRRILACEARQLPSKALSEFKKSFRKYNSNSSIKLSENRCKAPAPQKQMNHTATERMCIKKFAKIIAQKKNIHTQTPNWMQTWHDMVVTLHFFFGIICDTLAACTAPSQANGHLINGHRILRKKKKTIKFIILLLRRPSTDDSLVVYFCISFFLLQ